MIFLLPIVPCFGKSVNSIQCSSLFFQQHKCTFGAGVLPGCHIEFKFCDQKIDIILVTLLFIVPADSGLWGSQYNVTYQSRQTIC